MYEDSWYSFVPELHPKKDEPTSQSVKSRRRESLLKQPNGSNQPSDLSDQILELFEETPQSKGPPKATLARRAKSYSDFYEVAVAYLARETEKEKFKYALSEQENKGSRVPLVCRYEEFEDDLLDASQEEYQLYKDQLELSERHLDSLLDNTASALDLLASLSESFKSVDSQTTAFQAQCEDFLAEQKRIRDLANDVGTNLQYYSYLEPLTRRLNAPGARRLVRSSDFLELLKNLNTCIEFMDQHHDFRDSTIYKTRYMTLLERALNLILTDISMSLREVSEEVSKQLRSKDQTETAEYVLLYGKYESVMDKLGSELDALLTTQNFAYGRKGDDKNRASYAYQYHNLYRQLLDSYLKSRQTVGTIVLKNLQKFVAGPPAPQTEFTLFSRRCVQYVFDTCHNELKLAEKFFHHGPLMLDYSVALLKEWNITVDYVEKLEQNRLAHVTTLYNQLAPYLSSTDLHRVCDMVNWLENTYMASNEDSNDGDSEGRRSAAHFLLNEHLWPLSDQLFIKAAKELEYFKPSSEDLKIVSSSQQSNGEAESPTRREFDEKNGVGNDANSLSTPVVSNAYPTVKTAVELLILYNDSSYVRAKKGDVLYEIVHQTTESLQRAATLIKRNSNIMNAQIFLIKNLMLIENLFMTHEIPDSVRQSAELDFSPIWDTIRELQLRKQLFNPLAYITPLVRGHLLPAVVDHLLDARKELEKVLVQQITAFTKYWQSRLMSKDSRKISSAVDAERELGSLLERVFEDETTRAALWRMIRSNE